ncbi:MAG: DUF4139 domain-containing protein [Candidatus Eremiobacteraeota bacterium]|nr:DUF4139 domain-containing protein [Candidatus Eremiobacteraeota bacterium]
MEERQVLDTSIDTVTVFHKAALVQRLGRLPDLTGKITAQFLVKGLPLAMDSASLRVGVIDRSGWKETDGKEEQAGKRIKFIHRSGWTVRNIIVEVDRIDDEQKAAEESPATLEPLEDEIIRLGGEMKGLQSQIDEVKKWMAMPPSLPAGEENVAMKPFPFHAWEGFVKTCEKHLERLSVRKREIQRKLSEAVQREQQARALLERGRLARCATAPVRYCRNLVITLARISESGEAPESLELSYIVPGACWKPVYSLHIDKEYKNVRLVMGAQVAQRSGEDWPQAKLRFSGASLQRVLALPDLPSKRIGRAQKLKPPSYRVKAPPPQDLFAAFDRWLQQEKVAEKPLFTTVDFLFDSYEKTAGQIIAESTGAYPPSSAASVERTLQKAGKASAPRAKESPSARGTSPHETVKQLLKRAFQAPSEEQAVQLYEEVLTLDPTNPTACRELTRLASSLFDDEQVFGSADHDASLWEVPLGGASSFDLSQGAIPEMAPMPEASYAEQSETLFEGAPPEMPSFSGPMSRDIMPTPKQDLLMARRSSIPAAPPPPSPAPQIQAKILPTSAPGKKRMQKQEAFREKALTGTLMPDLELDSEEVLWSGEPLAGPGNAPDFSNFELDGIEDRQRGRLRMVRSLSLSERVEESETAVMQRIARAVKAAQVTLPGLEDMPSFQCVYEAETRAHIPGDGYPYRIDLFEGKSGAKVHFRSVPMTDPQVFRRLIAQNPFPLPLLGGAVQVFLEKAYLFSTTLSDVGREGALTFSLGVEPRLRVARNTSFSQDEKGLVAESSLANHRVTIQVRSRLPEPAEVEVIERIPVKEESEKKIDIKIITCEPKADLPEFIGETRLRGAHRWNLAVAPGEEASIRLEYRIAIPSKMELAGGNRRI